MVYALVKLIHLNKGCSFTILIQSALLKNVARSEECPVWTVLCKRTVYSSGHILNKFTARQKGAMKTCFAQMRYFLHEEEM